MSDDDKHFVINVVGALALAVADRLSERTTEAAMHGPSAAAVLITLRFTPDLPVDDLARTVGISVPGAINLLNRLETAGLLLREVGSKDRRRRHPRLTPAGKALAEKVLAARHAIVDDAVGVLDDSELWQLGRIGERLLTTLSGTRDLANHLCRLCDERVCPDDRCPSELALPPELRLGTAAP